MRKRADLNVIGLPGLRRGDLAVHDGLPAGRSRILQGVGGYVATFVAGSRTRTNDQDTGARPGRGIRARGPDPGPERPRTFPSGELRLP